MDRFALVTGTIGFVLLAIALVLLVHSTVRTIQRKRKVIRFAYSLILFLIVLGFSSAFIYLSLFLQTFSRYTHEEKIGWVYAESANDSTRVTFYERTSNRLHFFMLTGNQWMIEGYFLRWNTALRWLGADAYYRITRFSGRWENADSMIHTIYQMHPEENLWRFLLKHAEKIPGVDTAYGIGAFQYPSTDTFYVYINDTGFILRKQ